MENPVIMSNFDYHMHSAISKSDLDLINRSPAYYKCIKANPKEQTPAMLFGSMVHKLVLEPSEFDGEYAVMPHIDRRTKSGKEAYSAFLDECGGRTIVDDELFNSARSAADSVMNHPVARKLLTNGCAELSYFWEEDGVQCKCRPDYLRTDLKCAVDLKTTLNASPESFAKSAYDYRYHVQAAWYLRGLKACGVDVENFIFIAVENKPPYTVCVYAADQIMLEFGDKIALDDLETFRKCLESDKWFGYEESPIIHSLSLPDWVTRKYF